VSSHCRSTSPVRCCRTRTPRRTRMKEILRALEVQRWDDHRYYHHSRVNQSLHFVSATSFLCSYALVSFQPVIATLIAWLVAMTAPPSGPFFLVLLGPPGYAVVPLRPDAARARVARRHAAPATGDGSGP